MKTLDIKGLCEHCGFAFKGTIKADKNGDFPFINCPRCHKETENWDEATVVDMIEREEHNPLDYKDSAFEAA